MADETILSVAVPPPFRNPVARTGALAVHRVENHFESENVMSILRNRKKR